MASAAALRCGACLSLGSALDSCHAAVDYAYPWDSLIQRFKYSDGTDLGAAPALARGLAQVMRNVAQRDTSLAQALIEAAQSAWIIPVALHPDRQQERGFNQASVLAQALFPKNSKIRNDLLMRIKKTASQATLAHDARAYNLKDAFIAAPELAHELQGTTVTLIDDVTTTTATLGAAAAALRRAGARHIHALVFARAA